MTAPRAKFRGQAGRTVAAVGAMATISALVAPHAGATSVGDLRYEAQALEARIGALGAQESQLSERYDAAVLHLSQAQAGVAQAKREVTVATHRATAAKAVLLADAVNAYVNSGSGSLNGSGPADSIASADASLLRAEYQQTLAVDQSDSEYRYRLAGRQASAAEANLEGREMVAVAAITSISGDKKRVESVQTVLEVTETQVKGRIATLIAQQQAAARRAAQLAAEQRLAATRAAAARAAEARLALAEAAQTRVALARAAAAQASAAQASATRAAADRAAAQQAGEITPATTRGAPALAPAVPTPAVPTPPVPTPPVPTPPVPASAPPIGPVVNPPAPSPGASSQAAAAVAAAESRVGDPYVYAAAGPNAFDCSGLVMWAYEQVGISLPHFSGSQYADTTHIPMSDLEPGDLVFFSDPGEHVAMYVGNGEVVQAPYTGADVQIVPLYSEFVLASRVVG